ncbi:MAG: nicotinamide-nucleotide amidohydrolase family protein [Clostridia bacterium]|nr:nicotinamide-nucleotide amidohydrolase family protein [Clostridia bacterium]
MSQPITVTHVIGVFGLSESAVAQRIAETLMSDNPTVDTASDGSEVSVTITASAITAEAAEALCQSMTEDITERLGAFVYGVDAGSLQQRVVSLLREKHLKIATAESCTAGILSGRLTEIAGASEVFECGIAAYSNQIKHSVLGVPSDQLELYGAVSPEVASAMAVGVRRISGADFGVGITGVAGPAESEGKPCGTVYIALADDKRVWVKKLEEFDSDRDKVRALATTHALDLARRYLEALPAIMAGAQLLHRPSSEKQPLPVATPNRHTIGDHLLLSRAHGKAAVFRCLAIWLLIFILIVAVALSSYNFVYRPLHNEQIYNDLESLYNEPAAVSDASVEKGSYPDGMLAQFYVLYDRNPDIRGWIDVDGTAVRYPVMDGRSDFYAHRNFDQSNSVYGVPYFDSGNDFTSPAADNRVLTVYGNGTEGGQMFAPLLEYRDIAFFAQHQYLTLNTIYNNARWQVWAVMVVSAADHNADFDYTRRQFESNEDYAAFLEEIRARSLFETTVTPTVQDSLLMLSVDSRSERNIPEERLVVVARKWPAGEAEPSFAAAESDHVKWPEVSEPTVVSGAGSASAPDTARSTQHTGAPTADPARPTAPERTVRPTTAVTTPTTASTTAEVTAPTTIPIENSLPEEFSGGEA